MENTIQKKLAKNPVIYYALLLIGAVILLCFYKNRFTEMNTLRMLPDEYGYLANAAYFTGTDWTNLTNAYYGFGYSFLLMPLFWLKLNGAQMVLAAHGINIAILLVTYFVAAELFRKMIPFVVSYFSIALSFVMCLYPYLRVSSVSVCAEALLVLMLMICSLVLYQALQKEEPRYYLALGMLLAYTYFVHARSIIFLAVLAVTFMIGLCKKKIKRKNLLLLMLSFGLIFACGSVIRQGLIENVYSDVLLEGVSYQEQKAAGSLSWQKEKADAVGMAGDAMDGDSEKKEETLKQESVEINDVTEEPAKKLLLASVGSLGSENNKDSVRVDNLLSVGKIIERIQLRFAQYKKTMMVSLLAKLIYLFVATAGTFYIGVLVAFRDMWNCLRKKEDYHAVLAIEFTFAATALLTILALTINSPANTDRLNYMVYGRYYEHLVLLPSIVGIAELMNKRIKIWRAILLFALMAGLLYLGLKAGEMYGMELLDLDTYRMASISYIYADPVWSAWYDVGMTTLFRTTAIFMAILLLANQVKYVRCFVWIALMVLFLKSDSVLLDNLVYTSETYRAEKAITDEINAYVEGDEIYFVDGNKKKTDQYSGLQAMLGCRKLVFITEEEYSSLAPGSAVISGFMNSFMIKQENVVSPYGSETYSLFLMKD